MQKVTGYLFIERTIAMVKIGGKLVKGLQLAFMETCTDIVHLELALQG